MEEGTATTASGTGLGALAVEQLQRLIRADTVNPPGDEHEVQAQTKSLLEDAGFEVELLEAEPKRANLIAKLRGRADGPTMTLLSHVDTVKADREEWSRDPWSGELVDGWVWGRGALDMKGQVAAEIAACLELGRSGWRPARGTLQLVITADEETGGDLGARWLCEEHPDKVRSDFVVNEGGGYSFEHDGRRIYTLAVGEKGIFRIRVTTSGVAGHASLPKIGENALLKLAPLVARLSAQPPPEPTAEGLGFLSALYGEDFSGQEGVDRGLARLRDEQPLLADFLAEPNLSVTLTPTRTSAGEKANVIPSSAEVLVDTRVPPGMTGDDAAERIRGVLGEGDYELEFSEAVVGNASPFESGFADAIRDWVDENDPGAGLVPMAMPGFSDSHWFRKAFDSCLVYGFCPHREISLLEAAPLIHGADERVPASDVGYAAGFFADISKRMLGEEA
jgi:acetylornithine deacetylase/succinyl-diaminopimelate desuccinylase-like protein